MENGMRHELKYLISASAAELLRRRLQRPVDLHFKIAHMFPPVLTPARTRGKSPVKGN